jgi:hypothetical protein
VNSVMQIVFTAKEVNVSTDRHEVSFTYRDPLVRAQCSCGWGALGPRRQVYDAAAVHDINPAEEPKDQ